MAARWAPDRIDRERYPGPGLDLPVLFGDLDTNMHVNNVMMGRFFEESRVDTHFRAGVPHILHEVGMHNLIARVAIDYVREARYRKPLHVRLRVASIGTTSATYEQAAWQGEDCVALAEVVAVCRSADGAAAWPDEARAALEQLRDPTLKPAR
ncbi:MAG TPA: thioesterase family protein [Mycobacteriales bacterium]|nr:thioesterase family protein [Mycobacteriales bacterium]